MFHRLSHLRYAVSLKAIGIHARSFVSLDEIRGTDDSFECFIASVEELLRNLDFFLPRRNGL